MDTPTDSQSPEPATEPQLSFGQKRVRADFNPSKFPDVDTVKNKTAALIDFLAGQQFTSVFHEGNPKQDGEKIRLASKAIDLYEEACMWAVKALTA